MGLFGQRMNNMRDKPHNDSNPVYGDMVLEIDAMMGEKNKKIARQQNINLLQTAAMVILAAGLVYVATLSKTVLQVIQMEPSGQASVQNGVVVSGDYRAPDTSINYYLRQFIENSFSVPVDYKWLQKNINSAYNYIGTSNASGNLTSQLKQRDPFLLSKKNFRVDVEIETCLKLNDKNWQIQWFETQSDASNERGTVLKRIKYRGVFLIEKRVPTPETVMANPTGIYITNFDLQEIPE